MYKKTGIIPLFAYLSPACFEFLQTHFTVSTERARKELGWEEPRPWREVIRELIKEYKTESSMLLAEIITHF
jgi:nucleoside-diphosphate-sugar epimerase